MMTIIPRMILVKEVMIVNIITDQIKLHVVEETVVETIVAVVETEISILIMIDQVIIRRVNTVKRLTNRITVEIVYTATITAEVVASKTNVVIKRKELTLMKMKLPSTGVEVLILPSSTRTINNISNQIVIEINNPR